MSDQPATEPTDTQTLDFYGKEVRAVIVAGVPYFLFADLLTACGLDESAAEYVNSNGFPSFGKHIAADGSVYLSATGTFYWADHQDLWERTLPVSWTRRTSRQLCPNVDRGNPSMFFKLVKESDGWTHMPPRHGSVPKKCGWRGEAEDLQWGDYSAYCAAEEGNGEWHRTRREERKAAGETILPLGLGPRR